MESVGPGATIQSVVSHLSVERIGAAAANQGVASIRPEQRVVEIVPASSSP